MVAENQQQMQVRLPDAVTLALTPGDVVAIISALQEYGPYKVIFPVIRKIEQQLLSQQLKSEFKGSLPGAPPSAPPVPGVPVPPSPVLDDSMFVDLEVGHIPV